MAKSKLKIPEKPSLSDWIQFLNERCANYETSFSNMITNSFTMIILTVALITLFINANQLVVTFLTYNISVDISSFNISITALIVVLTIISSLLVLTSLIQRFYKKSKYIQIAELLKDTLKGNYLDPEKIKVRYFEIIEPKKKLKKMMVDGRL